MRQTKLSRRCAMTAVIVSLLASCLVAPTDVQGAVIAHWSFDETGGTTAADATDTLNANGVLKTAVASGSGVNLNAPGVFGSGVSMDGVAGSYMTVPYVDGIQTSSYTMAAWVKQADTGQNAIFSDWNGPHAYWFRASNGKLGMHHRSGSGSTYGDAVQGEMGSVPTGAWQHVAFRWDRDAKAGVWYVGGQPVGYKTTTKADVNMPANNRDVHIGWKQDSGDTFNGSIDELWVFDESLDSRRIQALAATNRPDSTVNGPTAGNAVGINFKGNAPTAMGVGEVAGVAAQTNWNNAAGTAGSVASLLDAQGNTTAASVAWSGSPNVHGTGIPDIAGDFRMMRGNLDTGNTTTTTINVTDVPFENYYVLTYFDGSNGNQWRRGRYTVSAGNYGSTGVIAEDNESTNFSGSYKRLNSNVEGNYVIHGMLQGDSSFTLTATPTSGSTGTIRAPINGLQVVDLGTADRRIDLADVVAGGDGTGTGTYNDSSVWITPVNPYAAYAGSDLIDATFVPNASAALPGTTEVQIDSDGNTFDFSPWNSATGTWGKIVGGPGQITAPTSSEIGIGDFADEGRSIIGMHATKGITFDLEAMMDANADINEFTHFTTIVGDSRPKGGGSIDYFVLLDGELAAMGIDLTNTEEFVSVNIPDGARFLTLAITDSGNGRDSDHAYFGDPLLHYAVPEPASPLLLLLGIVGVLLARRRLQRNK